MDAKDSAYLKWLEAEQFATTVRAERIRYWLVELAWGAGTIATLSLGWGGLIWLLNSGTQ